MNRMNFYGYVGYTVFILLRYSKNVVGYVSKIVGYTTKLCGLTVKH